MTGDENVDFKSIINLALSNKIPWVPLRTLLHELTPTFEASRQLNDILLDELQLIHSKQKEIVELSNESEVKQLDDFIDSNNEIDNSKSVEIEEDTTKDFADDVVLRPSEILLETRSARSKIWVLKLARSLEPLLGLSYRDGDQV